ncbi:MAG: thiol reductase thioredoxin [Ruminiclostridium sp.]|jgi:thioredoxin 1|nr:thiol reductase thioredoxin [Ruminiclostridium sp.]
MSTVIVTQDNISSEIFHSSVPVLIDFWSSHDREKKAYASLEEISEEMKGVAKIVRINVNDEPDIAYRFKVNQVPTMLVYRGGTVTDTIVGQADKGTIKWLLGDRV